MSDKTWTTFRMLDGSPVMGEYSWVDSAETFDGVVETTKVVKETWVLMDTEVVTFEPVFFSDIDYDEEEDF